MEDLRKDDACDHDFYIAARTELLEELTSPGRHTGLIMCLPCETWCNRIHCYPAFLPCPAGREALRTYGRHSLLSGFLRPAMAGDQLSDLSEPEEESFVGQR